MPSQPTVKHDPDHHLFRRGEVYYVSYKLAGQRYKQSLDTNDVRKARKKRDQILSTVAAQREGRVVEREKTWQEAVDSYLAHQDGKVAAGELTAGSAKRYACSLVQITVALGWEPGDGADGVPPRPIPLSAITKATIADFVEARREEERATSTILNDLTAWSRVLAHAVRKDFIEENPVAQIDRREIAGRRRVKLRPPTDGEVDALARQIAGWSDEIARLIRWLRGTGMRLAEALQLRAEDVHPCRTRVTLRRGVKRGLTRTIDLGAIAAMLTEMPQRGRLFASLPADSAVVSTRYGQWCRQRQGREERLAKTEARAAIKIDRFRLHDLRHAFACASLIDDSGCIYRLSRHLGHRMVQTTEIYTAHLRDDGAMWHYERRPDLFGALPPERRQALPAA
jgi:integrase/recombinase XerD